MTTEANKIPTATIPMPRRERETIPSEQQIEAALRKQVERVARDRDDRDQQPSSQRLAHPQAVEMMASYSNMIEEADELRSELRRVRSDLEMALRTSSEFRQRYEQERMTREKLEHDMRVQGSEFDVIVRTMMAVQDRISRRAG